MDKKFILKRTYNRLRQKNKDLVCDFNFLLKSYIELIDLSNGHVHEILTPKACQHKVLMEEKIMGLEEVRRFESQKRFVCFSNRDEKQDFINLIKTREK